MDGQVDLARTMDRVPALLAAGVTDLRAHLRLPDDECARHAHHGPCQRRCCDNDGRSFHLLPLSQGFLAANLWWRPAIPQAEPSV